MAFGVNAQGGAAALTSEEIREAMDRANATERTLRGLVLNDSPDLYWSEQGKRLIFTRETAPGEKRFLELNLDDGEIHDAFDHQTVADALAEAVGQGDVAASRLPIDHLIPCEESGDLEVEVGEGSWVWRAAGGELARSDGPKPVIARPPGTYTRSETGGDSQRRISLDVENRLDAEIELWWLDGAGNRSSYGTVAPGGSHRQSTFVGHAWEFVSGGRAVASFRPGPERNLVRVRVDDLEDEQPEEESRRNREDSPDGRWRAEIAGHNLFVVCRESGERRQLSREGSRRSPYGGPFYWAPDSRHVVAWRQRRVETPQAHIVQALPPDGFLPKLIRFPYPRPGDELAVARPRLFSVEEGEVDERSDGLPQDLRKIRTAGWLPDSSGFVIRYVHRNNQQRVLVRIETATRELTELHREESATFLDYSTRGKNLLRVLGGGGQLLFASEVSGHNHLYQIDLTAPVAGAVQLTQGEWNVRDIIHLDEEGGWAILRTIGGDSGNLYHHHYVRLGLESGSVTRLTTSTGHHDARLSPCGRYLVAEWSRPDHAPVTEVRRVADGVMVAEIARADTSLLEEKGWLPPEPFVAMGRDGETPVYGLIFRPVGFDPEKKHAIVENIYAGPHSFFVPQGFQVWSGLQRMAELGFVVVKIDGMGTNWRHKAFHDVAWKNLRDAGLPDRRLWIEAAAATRPWMDLGRVGIYGGSAGGQSAMGALLFHGDFYRVAVADCGCHDNRVDKMWWNEAWMGWPVDESYEENSNVTHAAKLEGELMLIVGELDQNVDPASTFQVAAALQRAGKEFDLVVVHNEGHGAASTPYGRFRQAGFLMRRLGGPEARKE